MPPAEQGVKQPKPTHSTQSALLITEIKDGIVVMQDGSLRAVVLASAINFDLMSPQEQDAVEYSFQAFLNSLHFPVQILIKSQRMDLDNYLEKLQKLRQDQDNQLLAVLMDDYIANIRALLEEVNIMDKQFFVVVPFFPPLAVTKNNLASNLGNIFKPTKVVTMGAQDFEQYKRELAQRVQQVASQLIQMGVRAVPLNTQELIDLFYTSYNPDVATNQKLIDATQFEGAAVTRGERPETALPSTIVSPAELPEQPTETVAQPTPVTSPTYVDSQAYAQPQPQPLPQPTAPDVAAPQIAPQTTEQPPYNYPPNPPQPPAGGAV